MVTQEDPDPRGIPIHCRPVLQGPAVRVEHFGWMQPRWDKLMYLGFGLQATPDIIIRIALLTCYLSSLLLINISFTSYFHYIVLRWASPTAMLRRAVGRAPPSGHCYHQGACQSLRQLGSRMTRETGVEQMIHLIWPNYIKLYYKSST